MVSNTFILLGNTPDNLPVYQADYDAALKELGAAVARQHGLHLPELQAVAAFQNDPATADVWQYGRQILQNTAAFSVLTVEDFYTATHNYARQELTSEYNLDRLNQLSLQAALQAGVATERDISHTPGFDFEPR
ncbi:hypothetical protein [Conchiformibius steedae]|uniref:hypothetical protein n=1 Tax=Conchiformibius steedae TaxID=153493 RepID=UPI0026EB82C6|nr:hypothetical protein [Conchiformibius steedae]